VLRRQAHAFRSALPVWPRTHCQAEEEKAPPSVGFHPNNQNIQNGESGEMEVGRSNWQPHPATAGTVLPRSSRTCTPWQVCQSYLGKSCQWNKREKDFSLMCGYGRLERRKNFSVDEHQTRTEKKEWWTKTKTFSWKWKNNKNVRKWEPWSAKWPELTDKPPLEAYQRKKKYPKEINFNFLRRYMWASRKDMSIKIHFNWRENGRDIKLCFLFLYSQSQSKSKVYSPGRVVFMEKKNVGCRTEKLKKVLYATQLVNWVTNNLQSL